MKNKLIFLNGILQSPNEDYTDNGFGIIESALGWYMGDIIQIIKNSKIEREIKIEKNCKGIDLRYSQIYYKE